MADLVGQQLGKYRLTRLLGSGGFAEVYLGVHSHLESEAAIKVLHAHFAKEREIEKFRQEARALARLTHQNIIRVLDFDVENGTPYLVLDYAPNGSLRHHLPPEQPITPAQVLPYLTQVADALQYAHDQHLIHRDIKPENMLVGRRSDVLLTDFGIAIVAQSTSMQQTQGVAGTASYMAPEQLQGKPRQASDQYSLGVVVYEWLTGDRPFHGSFTEVASQHLFTPPPPLREKVPTISPAVEEVVLTAMAKDPRERFGSVRAFANAFRQASRDQTVFSVPTLAPGQPLTSAPGQSITEIQNAPTRLITPGTAQAPGSDPSIFSATTHITPPLQPAPPPAPEADNDLESAPTIPPRHWPNPPAGDTLAVPGLATMIPAHRSNTPAGTAPPPADQATFAGPAAPAPAAPDTPAPAASAKQRPGGISRRAVIAAGGVGLVLLGSGATLLFLRGTSGTANAPGGQPTATPTTQPATQTPGPTATPTTPPAPLGTLYYTFTGHTEDLRGAAWSPDGTRIASCSGGTNNVDHTVRVWDAANGNVHFIYRGHANQVRAVAWSPDGSKIASASFDHTVQIFDATNGSPLFTYREHTAEVRALSWSPDGTHIASGGSDTTVRVWEAASGTTIFTYTGHNNVVYAVQWSPDGTRIASGGVDQTAQVWNAPGGGNVTTFRGHSGAVLTLAWSSDGAKLVSGSTDHLVKVWDQTSANLLATYQGHTDWVWCVAWSRDKQRIASASIDSHVLLWDTSSGANVYIYRGHSGPATTAAWSPDGQKIASGGSDRTVQIWQAR